MVPRILGHKGSSGLAVNVPQPGTPNCSPITGQRAVPVLGVGVRPVGLVGQRTVEVASGLWEGSTCQW
jgi:hypothetical protein